MNPFELLPLARALGWTLLHSLWQGALIGLLAAGLLHATRGWAPSGRYRLAAASLATMVLVFLGTLIRLLPRAGYALSVDGALLAPVLGPTRLAGKWAQLWASAASWVPWLALAWGVGLCLRLVKVAGGLVWLYGPCLDAAEPPPNGWQQRFDALRQTSGVRRLVRFASSRNVDSLLVLGWLRPVILVPAGAFLAMPPEALEALVIHELAHIRRGDYLANLVQTLAETILFYHPAVWWLSGRIRQEREHCCDDAAVRACGDPILYASALLGLEELRTQPKLIPDLALAASGGRLMSRIQRLLRPHPQTGAVSPALFLLAAGLLTAALGAASLTARPAAAPKAAPKAEKAAQAQSEAKPDEPVDLEFSQIVIKHQPEAPAYPQEAKEAGIQGTVVVLLTIDVEGVVSSAKAISGPEELHACAVDYAKAWTFEPAKVKGRPVPARFKLTMPFKLR